MLGVDKGWLAVSHYGWRKREIMGVLPIGSMGRLYIYLQIYLITINYIDVGKYTSPTDPMGYKPNLWAKITINYYNS